MYLITLSLSSLMIRQGSIDDFKIIRRIERSSFSRFAYSDDEIDYMLRTANTLVFENGEPEGYLAYYMNEDECHIESIAVMPRYKRKGIGTLLMQEMENICKRNGKRRIVLEVRERNRRAINFYKKLGFVEHSILENYYMLSYRGSRNALFMVKEICSGPEPCK